MDETKSNKISRRDSLKAFATLPVLGYFGYAYNANATNVGEEQNYLSRLKIDKLAASEEKLLPPTGSSDNVIRFGLVGNGWRGEQLLKSLGYVHPEYVKESTVDGKPDRGLRKFLNQENLNVEFAGVCDTFEVHSRRGVEISANDVHPGGRKNLLKKAKLFANYRDMIASDEIDASFACAAGVSRPGSSFSQRQ